MTYYTLGTAAHACGLNKSTVLRAIKAGKISATRDEHGQWQIDPAELHRVYPPVASTDAAQPGEQRYAPAPSRDRTDELVAQLREQLADMRNERDRARADADTWRAAFERECAQRALPAPSNDAQSAQATPATAWQRFLRWRRATGCFAGAGLLLVLATVAATAQQQQGQGCFAVVMNHSTGGGSLGAIWIDQCTGKTWVLVRASVARGATAVRWFPITVEANEAVSAPAGN
jgi:hypothetical protein